MPGNLTLKPLEVNLTKNLPNFEKKHPYYVVALGKTKIRSQEAKTNENNLLWEEAVSVPSYTDEACILKLKTKRPLLKDKTIGYCKIDLGEMTSEKVSRWYDILRKNKITGRILIEGSISPDGHMNSQSVAGTTQSMNALEEKRNPLIESQDNARQVASLGNLEPKREQQLPIINEGNVVVIEKPETIPVKDNSIDEDIPIERTEQEEVGSRVHV